MKIYEVSAFVRNGVGGNLAGVVIVENVLSKNEMQNVATKLNYSETVFISVLSNSKFKFEYFTPVCEIDICGHATLAAFEVLKQQNLISNKLNQYKCRLGEFNAIVENEIYIQMDSVKYENEYSKNVCANILNINEKDIVNIPMSVSVGLSDVMVIVKSNEILNSIDYNKELMLDFCKSENIVGFHILAIDNGYYTRNFAPLYGIDEESATGSSSGSMYMYLVKNNLAKLGDKISFMQGDILNSPSSIFVYYDNNIFVGGNCLVLKSFKLS